MDLWIGEDGRPRDIKPQRPGDPMNEAAAKAIESWQFRPARANGELRGAAASIQFECGGSPTLVPDSPVYRVGNGVSAPVLNHNPEPDYSKEAREAKLQGDVALAAVVDSTGHPTRLRVVKTLGMGLDEKAMEAVSQWRFKPGMKDAKPVSVFTQVSVGFRLQ